MSADAAAAAGPRGFSSVLSVWDEASDGRDALAVAADVARAEGARLSVCAIASATGERELARFARASGRDPDTLKAALGETTRAAVEKAAGEICPDLAPAVAVAFGKPFIEIVRAVATRGHDLVVKNAEEIGGPARRLLASTDQHLLRKCPAPVLLHRDGGAGLAGPVLAAVDVSGEAASEPETEEGLNRAILRTALALASARGAPLHLVSAWTVPAEGLVRIYGDGGEGDLAAYADEVERQHARDLNRLVEEGRRLLAEGGGRSVPIAPHLVRGLARTAIPRAVADLSAGLLVMGTVARTGVPGLIIGNTAEDVLNTVETSVVAVKPPGYVSPVAP